MRNFSDEVSKENRKTYLEFNILFPRNFCLLWDNVEKCGTDGQATNENITRRMPLKNHAQKGKDAHSEYAYVFF